MPEQIIILLVLLSLPLLPTFWAILDIPKRKFPTPGKKIMWFLIVSTLPFVGAMFYIIFARRHTEPL
jgi:hypothetical protein